MGMWVVVVEGLAYGFFGSEHAARAWGAQQFPVATAQARMAVYEFCSVDPSEGGR